MLGDQFTGKLNSLLGVHQIHGAVVVRGPLPESSTHVIGDDRPSDASFLRGHHNDAVGGTGTVQRRGSRILQHVDTLDVLRVDAGNGIPDAVDVIRVVQIRRRHIHGVLHDDAVQHPQRFAVTDKRGGTADTQFGYHAHLTGVRRHNQVGNLSLQHLVEGRNTGNIQILHLPGSHGTGGLPAVYFLITGNHHLIHLSRLLFKDDIDDLLSGISHFPRLHSDKRIYQPDIFYIR